MTTHESTEPKERPMSEKFRKMDPVASTPCPECPWLVSNADRTPPAPFIADDFYSRAHLLRCWHDVADGRLTACHAASDVFRTGEVNGPPWLAAYLERPRALRECPGSVVAALREVQYLLDAGSYTEYARQRPQGLGPEGAAIWVQRLAGAGVDMPELRKVIVDLDEITDPASFDEES